jgi:hypothetical protein
MYQISIFYDGKIVSNHNYTDAISAVHAFDKCVDHGTAVEFATYNLSEPNGKMHTKNFYKNGKVTVK